MQPMLIDGVLSPEEVEIVKEVLNASTWRHVDDDRIRRNMDEVYAPPLHWLHFRIRHRITEALGFGADDIMPSYIYAMRYLPDSECRWHRDRDVAEWNITTTIDDGGHPWPLKVKPQGDPENVVAMIAPPGSGVLYHRDDTHGRKTRDPSHPPFITVIFHYASANYRGSIL